MDKEEKENVWTYLLKKIRKKKKESAVAESRDREIFRAKVKAS